MVVFGADKKASQAPSFSDIVGQRDLKDGLLAVAADDDLDGLLVRGEKGTAKSTAVRALADLLPVQEAVADCPYGCSPTDPDRQCSACLDRTDPPVEERAPPLVTLPLGATRDRVVGTLSVADALAGDHEFDPGLLAQANRGILYVDEVNLLDDHLVDVLLDAAAGGVNRVERDGVTVTHPAEFTLVGTMNPEEGQLRPQLRDRFALQTDVTACDDIQDRVAIIDRALDGVADEDNSDPERTPGERLATARESLQAVDLAPSFRERIAELCRDAGVDGHRGDIATARAARVFAALDGRTTVLEGDIERAAEFALPHRMQSDPFEAAGDVDDVLDDHFDDEETESDESGSKEDSTDLQDGAESDGGDGDSGSDAEAEAEASDDTEKEEDTDSSDAGNSGETEQRTDSTGDGDSTGVDDETPGEGDGTPAEADSSDSGGEGSDDNGGGTDEDEAAPPLLPGQSRAGVGESTSPDIEGPAVDTDGGLSSGRADASTGGSGPTVRTERADADGDVDVAASVRAAAKRGSQRLGSRDLRQSVRSGDAGTLVVFAVDASASMRPAMRAAKGTVIELLRDAYQARDEVAVVTFAGDSADVVLPPTDSVSLAARHLKELPTGDRTPLAAGLTTAGEVLEQADPDAGIAVVVTDGRANTADGSPVAASRDAAGHLGTVADRTIVVDVDADVDSRAGVTDVVAEATDATVVPLSALTAETIDSLAGE